MNNEPRYELRAPSSTVEWEAYHGIRRKVLFENRGRIGVYDKNHPDESREGNYPLILLLNGFVPSAPMIGTSISMQKNLA
jgi:hypothetical protein